MVPLAAQYWTAMCVYDNVEYNENEPTTVLGFPTLTKQTNAFFLEKNMLRAHGLLMDLVQDKTNFSTKVFVPEVVDQLRTFSLRTIPFHDMQQQQIGLDLFRFWPNANHNPKFTLNNFQIWLFTLSNFFDMFFPDSNTKYDTPNFICTRFDRLHDKLSEMKFNNVEISELYIFNMATQVIDAVSNMAAWAYTTIDFKSASLDSIKKIFHDLEINFSHVAEKFDGVIVEFIRFPNAVMEFYNRDY
jgi:hypothetical protein